MTRVIPSDNASASMVICKFMASLIEWATPLSPRKNTLLAILSNTFLQLSKDSLFPDAIITKLPDMATFGPPITGMSNLWISYS